MIYGYCRISTKKQSIDRQIRNIKAAFPEAQVKCLADCCAPLFGNPAFQEAALTVMNSCQVDVIR